METSFPEGDSAKAQTEPEVAETIHARFAATVLGRGRIRGQSERRDGERRRDQ
jgi:hypothetical protein